MSACRQFEDSIWEAAETEVVPPPLAAHLAQCEGCRRSFEAVSSAIEGLSALREVEAPDPTEAVRSALVARARRGAAVRFAAAVGVARAAAAALLVLTARPPDRRPLGQQLQRAEKVTSRTAAGPAPAAAPVVPRATQAPAPPRSRSRALAKVTRSGRALTPEPALSEAPEAQEVAAEPSQTDAASASEGLILLVGTPQEPLPSSSCYVEVSLPTGEGSVFTKTVERDDRGEARHVEIACRNTTAPGSAQNGGG